MTSFEKFTRRKFAGKREPIVTITKNRIINFNSWIMNEYIKRFAYVIFYYDKKNYRIGIKLVDKESTDTYKIRKSRNIIHKF